MPVSDCKNGWLSQMWQFPPLFEDPPAATILLVCYIIKSTINCVHETDQ